jgi:hypothetical protein
LLQLVKSAGDGLPAVFEPLRGKLEGAKILSSSVNELKRKQVRCLFSEDAKICGRAGIINHNALREYKTALATPNHPPIVIKTTRIVNLQLMAEELSQQQLEGARFLLLVRDPRAVWASVKPWKGWAVRSVPIVCKLLAESLLTLPALASAAPGRVEVAAYEQWSSDMEGWAKRLGVFLNLSSSGMEDLARRKQRPPAAPKWLSSLTPKEVTEIEKDRHCKAYMSRAGYKLGRAEGADYSGLRSSAEMQAGLSKGEQYLLTQMLSLRQVVPNESAVVEPPEMEFEWPGYD